MPDSEARSPRIDPPVSSAVEGILVPPGRWERGTWLFRDETLRRLEILLDEAFRIPFTGIRFGIDGIIGLVPGLGDVIAGAIYESGRFTHADTIWEWGILVGSGVGLLASTQGRLYSSAFYALKDTRTPLKFAVIRIALTTVLGYFCAVPLPPILGIDPKWGVAGLTASAGVSGWVEFLLLRKSLGRRIGSDPVGARYLARLWGAAVLAAGVGWAFKELAFGLNPKLKGAAVLMPYGALYLLLAEGGNIGNRLRGLIRRR